MDYKAVMRLHKEKIEGPKPNWKLIWFQLVVRPSSSGKKIGGIHGKMF